MSMQDRYQQCKELYEKAIAAHPKIESKGKAMPYTSVNGHMFSFLGQEGKMGLRLQATDREEFIEKYKTNLMVQHWSVMKEYAEVPHDILENTKTLSEYLMKNWVCVWSEAQTQ